MARVVDVTEEEAILAMAAQLGLEIGSSEDLVIPGAGNLPPLAKKTLMDMGRVLVQQYNVEQQGQGGDAPTLPSLAPEPV
jgi:hypothetical protein